MKSGWVSERSTLVDPVGILRKAGNLQGGGGEGGGVNSSDSNEGRRARMGQRKMVFVSRRLAAPKIHCVTDASCFCSNANVTGLAQQKQEMVFRQ